MDKFLAWITEMLKEVEEGCSRFEAEVNKKCDGRWLKTVWIYFNA